ncbi:MerR family transcriptional regulator [Amycolatopsis sp. K13G38]|uniref:MerR family transcriptional regulator n=1 Tax=Amycolatopsis acididurans TaxID=2724524 RepID=A0ABX1J8F4_9PSEU|nr:MerR family transcriptional regulator [Amycolatopsis acididurans]NKQ54661.1 MerR family transcriptional regulator [Amycolatopsis acididurans]
MRMAELSRESGVTVATIKYYQREGLLPPGELTSPNQARYDASHVRRLKLVRALLDVGGLSIASVREVLAAIEDSAASTHDVLGLAQHGLPIARLEVSEQDRAWAMEQFEALAGRRGWQVYEDWPVTESLINVMCALREVGHEWVLGSLNEYAQAADLVAEADIDAVARLGQTEAIVEGAIVGTVLGDALFAALRRLAHAEVSRKRFG